MALTVREVVHDVVCDAAPDETPILDALAEVGDERVVRRMKRRRREQLGFGVSEMAPIVTAVVWIAVHEFCRAAADSSVMTLRARAAAAVRRLLRRPSPELTVPPLSPEQLQALHGRVIRDAVSSGMEAAAAEQLADRVVARLVLEEQPRDAEEPELQ
ncbi:hypothetical protein [Streptomyces sp. NPDC054866]